MRRHLRKFLLGAGLFVLLTPFECAFLYCDRHEFEPPICDQLFNDV